MFLQKNSVKLHYYYSTIFVRMQYKKKDWLKNFLNEKGKSRGLLKFALLYFCFLIYRQESNQIFLFRSKTKTLVYFFYKK